MRETLDYSFEVSLSTQTYDHKPNKTTEIPNMRFYKTTTDIGGFVEAIADGHCYTTVFPFDEFGIKNQKNDSNFLYSNFLSIDFDNSKVDMTTFIDSVRYKPTVAYTSCSNGQEGKGYRYRLVYCFDGRFESKEEYSDYAHAVLAANGIDEEAVDPISFKASMLFIGNGCGNIEVSVSNVIYSKEDFSNNILLKKSSNNNLKNNIIYNINNNILYKQYTPHNNIILNGTFIDKLFEDDYWNMKIEDILSKYHAIYPNIEHTPLPNTDEDTPYILFPKNYAEIKRDCRINEMNVAKRLKDGERRRKRLFINGIIRRLINPNITFDNLVFNLLYELYFYISNKDAENLIGKHEIFTIAKDVMKADLSKYESLRGSSKPWIVNEAYCKKHNLTPIQVKNMVVKDFKRQKIGELYDCSLTDKENVEQMKKYGVEVSERTLARWKKENGITKYKKKD